MNFIFGYLLIISIFVSILVCISILCSYCSASISYSTFINCVCFIISASAHFPVWLLIFSWIIAFVLSYCSIVMYCNNCFLFFVTMLRFFIIILLFFTAILIFCHIFVADVVVSRFYCLFRIGVVRYSYFEVEFIIFTYVIV